MNKNVHRVKTKAYYIMMFKNTYVKTESHHRIEKKQCHSDECTCHNDNITSHNAKCTRHNNECTSCIGKCTSQNLRITSHMIKAHHIMIKSHYITIKARHIMVYTHNELSFAMIIIYEAYDFYFKRPNCLITWSVIPTMERHSDYCFFIWCCGYNTWRCCFII